MSVFALRLRVGPVRLDTVDQDVPLATAPASGDLDRGNNADAPPCCPARHLRHRALGVVVGDGRHTETTTGQVIDQLGGCPGAVGSVGVQMEVDGVRRRQCQWLRRRGGCRNLVGGSTGRVCQGGSSANAPVGATILLPGSLADVSGPEPTWNWYSVRRGSQERWWPDAGLNPGNQDPGSTTDASRGAPRPAR